MQITSVALPILLVLVLTSVRWRPVQGNSTKDAYYNLYDTLFADKDYKKEIRPANSLNDPLVVTMEFFLLSIVDVNEKQQMLQTNARIEMIWDDDFLEWNSTAHGGIQELLVPQEKVYRPDIVLANSVTAQKLIGYDELPIRLNSVGIIIWEPTLLLATDCDIDVTYFPFETQKCTIDFETAISKSNEIDIDIEQGTSAINVEDFNRNGQWELIKTSAENLSNEGGKTKIRFTVIIERRRTFYVLNIILPVFFLSLTASLVFAIPADEGEKMGTGITVLLAFAVYLSIVSELVPNTSLQISILGLYLTILLGLSAFSVIICVFNLCIHHRDDDIPVGPKTAGFVRFVRSMLCMKRSNNDEETSSNQVSPSRPRSAADDNTRGMNNPALRSSQNSLHKPTFAGMPDPRHLPHIRGLNHSHHHHHEPDPRRQPDPRFSPSPMEEEDESSEKMSWTLVGDTLDWLFFVIFTLATVLVTLICLLYLHFGSIANAPDL